jgi:hypothetical protein
MIKLDPESVTTATSTRGGQTTTSTTDTLVVRYVEMNLVEGGILAIIDRGQMVGDKFVATEVPLWVDVKSDGSFASRDGIWTGKVDSAPKITAGLKDAFDDFLLASGAVSGKVV